MVANFSVFLIFTIVMSTFAKNIIFLPFDERFATRGMFLNLAQLIKSDHNIITPNINVLSSHKIPANRTIIDSWLTNVTSACESQACTLIVSSEMYLYGGLINSRISNDSYDFINNRTDNILKLKSIYKDNLKIYISNVIMRIPAYDGDFEEPWYWENYGKLLYLWSFYTDRYNVLHNESDHEMAQNISMQIPTNVLNEFVWRRNRNYQITTNLLEIQYNTSIFEKIWITLDDNAEYGLNRQEERMIRSTINYLKLNTSVNVYPGADEVGLTMLSKSMVDEKQNSPSVVIIYRDDSNKNAVPNYEGQPLNMSLINQVNAAGASINNVSSADIVILVNNWSGDSQQEADGPQIPQNYSPFEPYIGYKGVLVFADVMYSNGADEFFVKWLSENFKPNFGYFSYAGWNTAGNTLGTCISNGVLLYLYNRNNIIENKIFTYYRFLEDSAYQAYLRVELLDYIYFISKDDPNDLSTDLQFYETFVRKGFVTSMIDFESEFDNLTMNYTISDVYFPWNRTFEIGFNIN